MAHAERWMPLAELRQRRDNHLRAIFWRRCDPQFTAQPHVVAPDVVLQVFRRFQQRDPAMIEERTGFRQRQPPGRSQQQRNPSSLSSWRMLKLTTALVCPRAVAAAVKLPLSTTATNMFIRCRFSIAPPIVKKFQTVYLRMSCLFALTLRFTVAAFTGV